MFIDGQNLVDQAIAKFKSNLNDENNRLSVGCEPIGVRIQGRQFGAGMLFVNADCEASIDVCPNDIGVEVSARIDFELSSSVLIEHGSVD